jgi:hypothetical protein
MSFKHKAGGVSDVSGASGAGKFAGEAALDAELDEALRDFRMSVHAWSAVAYNRPRTLPAGSARKHLWQLASAWALGCALMVAGVSGGVFAHFHRPQAAVGQQPRQETRIAESRMDEAGQPAVEQRNQRAPEEEEDLLAKVDSDVSRQVPAAMEPLAQLMAGDVTQ